MIRLFKWAGIAAGILVLLAAVAAVLLPSLVNLERYRTLLAQRVGKALGRDVTLGELRVSLWLGIGAEAKGIQIAQAPGFGAEPFLAADSLRVRVLLLPLLHGQIKVASATLERPRIRIVHAQDGSWSVDDLLKGHAPSPPARPQPEGTRPGRAPLLGGLVLSKVSVRDGEIDLLDLGQPAPVTLDLADVNLDLRQDGPTAPITLRSRTRLTGAASGLIEVTGQIGQGDKEGPDLDATIAFKDLQLKAWQAPSTGGREAVPISGPLAGEVRFSGPLPRLAFDGTLNLKAAAIRVGGAFQKPAGEEARFTFRGQREGPGIRVTKLELLLGDTTADGTLFMPDLKSPHLTFTASSPKMNLDRLLAPPSPKRAGLAGGVAFAATAVRGDAKGGMPALSAQGRLTIGELSYRGLAWSAVRADIVYQGGVVQAPDVQATFMNGRLIAKAAVDLRGKTPRVSLDTRLEHVATEPLGKALALGPWKLTSDLSSESRAEFAGLALPEILGSVAGSGSIQLGRGRLTDYRPLDRLAEVVTPVLAAQGVRVRLNEFESLSGHYTLEKGFLRTKDLTLTKTEGTVTASGALSLLDSSLDFDVVAKLGRATVEAKVTGTTAQPIVIPKVARLQRKLEGELEKVLPGEQGKGLKDLFKGLFGR